MDISKVRKEYVGQVLNLSEAGPTPFGLFSRWLEQALEAEGEDANSMVLSTVGPDGAPSARVVLLKGFSQGGFVFYSNYESRKAKDLAANPRAALTLYWRSLSRQVRIEGGVEKISRSESERYFESRPLLSRLAAAVSPQSAEIPSRRNLEERLAKLERRYADGLVPCPVNWGGYRVRPQVVEFWQGREGRLHDRVLFRRTGEASWSKVRLAP